MYRQLEGELFSIRRRSPIKIKCKCFTTCDVSKLAGRRLQLEMMWICYFTQSLELWFGTLNVHKHFKTHTSANIVARYKFSFWLVPREWTRPFETSIWNTYPLKMLLYTLFGMMVWNSKLIQTPEKSCPRKHPSSMQVYFLTSSKGMD